MTDLHQTCPRCAGERAHADDCTAALAAVVEALEGERREGESVADAVRRLRRERDEARLDAQAECSMGVAAEAELREAQQWARGALLRCRTLERELGFARSANAMAGAIMARCGVPMDERLKFAAAIARLGERR